MDDGTPMHENRRHAALTRVLAALVAVAVAGLLAPGPAKSVAATLPYQDPDRPVAERVDDLLGRMTLADKIGQMTQAERAGVRPDDVTGYRLGSVLSGGGSTRTPNTPAAWADTYDAYQRAALATPLGIPLLYGLDAVHGDNDVHGSTIFPHGVGLGATRDPALVEQVGQAIAAEVTGAGLNWTGVPKGELGSDRAAIDDKPGFAEDEVATAVNGGLDMLMVPENWQQLLAYLGDAVQTGRIPMSRIDDANRRILTEKFRFGLFEHPYANRSLAGAAHRALARQAVRESQVLLKNDGVLPLAKTGGKIFVAGTNAADLGNQSGGWTPTRPGASGDTVPGTTILQGIRDAAGDGTTITYARDGSGIDGTYRAAIAVLGETPYAEGKGDRLDAEDLATLARLRASGVPVIVVLVAGRPLDIASLLGGWDALLAAWLPGSEGAGVADVLFGDYSPTGRLPVTWPRSTRQDGKAGLFAYGYGLTYPDSAADVAAPSVPGTPLASAVTRTGLRLSWTPATGSGGAGVDGYDVYRDGTLIASPMTTTTAVTGLTAGTAYSFTVIARDKAGNRSPASPALRMTTAPAAKGG